MYDGIERDRRKSRARSKLDFVDCTLFHPSKTYWIDNEGGESGLLHISPTFSRRARCVKAYSRNQNNSLAGAIRHELYLADKQLKRIQ